HGAGRRGIRSVTAAGQPRRTVPARQHHYRVQLAHRPVRAGTPAWPSRLQRDQLRLSRRMESAEPGRDRLSPVAAHPPAPAPPAATARDTARATATTAGLRAAASTRCDGATTDSAATGAPPASRTSAATDVTDS